MKIDETMSEAGEVVQASLRTSPVTECDKITFDPGEETLDPWEENRRAAKSTASAILRFSSKQMIKHLEEMTGESWVDGSLYKRR